MTTRSHPNRKSSLLMVTSLVLSAGMAFASDQSPQPPQPSPQEKARIERREKQDAAAARAPELRDETFRLMDGYVISNLQDSLGLTDEQFAKAVPLVKKLQNNRRECARKRMQALRLLRRSLNAGGATESGVADLLKEVKGATADERASAVRDLEALDAVLTPLQQAKYRVFEAEVDVRLHKLLARSQDRDRPTNR
jgi:Spy/CpxP family protein refolding chaperone